MNSLRSFAFLVKDVSRLYAKHFERHAVELGVTLPQCKVVAYLSQHSGVSQTRLAELTEIDPMMLVRILDRMEQDGWIERRADPEDRRVRRLFLKPAAKPVLAEIWRIRDRSHKEATIGLSAADHETLLHLLEQVHANLLASASMAAEAPQAVSPGTASRTRRAITGKPQRKIRKSV